MEQCCACEVSVICAQTYFLSDPFLRRDLEGVSVGVWVGTVREREREGERERERGGSGKGKMTEMINYIHH